MTFYHQMPRHGLPEPLNEYGPVLMPTPLNHQDGIQEFVPPPHQNLMLSTVQEHTGHPYFADEYAHHQQQAAAANAAAAYWQLPPAPKLSTAAARGWQGDLGGYYAPQPHPIAGLHAFRTPWTASFPMHPQVPVRGHDHQDIESHIMMQHRMSRQHVEPPNGGPVAVQPICDPSRAGHHISAQQSAAYPPDNHYSAYTNMPYFEQNSSWSASSAPFDQSQIHQPIGQFTFDLRGANYPSQMYQSISQQGAGPSPRKSLGPQQGQGEFDWSRSAFSQEPEFERQHRHSHSDWHIGQAYQQQPNTELTLRHAERSYPSAYQPVTSSEWQGDQHSRQARFRHSSAGREAPGDAFGLFHNAQALRMSPIGDPVPEAVVKKEAEPVGPQSSKNGLAPPSPDTLDKSGVPFSAFGAELIWYACASLLDPELIMLARAEDDIAGTAATGSPSSASASSSPSLNTPQTSPHSPHLGTAKDVDMSVTLLSTARLGERLLQVDSKKVNQCTSSFTRDPRKAEEPHLSDLSSPSNSGPGTPSLALPTVPCATAHLQTSPERGGDKEMSALRLTSPAFRVTAPRARSLMRTKSLERSKISTLSALSLVSPNWRWTNDREILPSLEEAADLVTAKAAETNARHKRHSAASPKDNCSSGIFALAGDVSPAFRRFAHQVLAQTLLSPTAFLIALLYSLRVPYLAVDEAGRVDAEAVEAFASPPSAAPFKLFTLGLMIANKHLDDNTFLNKTWNEVTGIPLPELNRMERYFLTKCKYEVSVPNSVWCSFLKRVRSREEGRLIYGSYQPSRQHRYQGAVASHLSTVRHAEGHTDYGAKAGPATSRRVLLAIEDMLIVVGSKSVMDPFDLSDSQDCIRFASAEVRPTSALLHKHKHCQSAPAKIMDLDDARSTSPTPARPRPVFDEKTRAWSHHTGSLGVHPRHSLGIFPSQAYDVPLAPSALLKLLNSGRSLGDCTRDIL